MDLLQVEQPTQPRGLSITEEQLYETAHTEAKRREEKQAAAQIKQILSTGSGLFVSLTSDGRRIEYDAAELTGVVIDDEEAADLRVLVALAINPDDPDLRFETGQLVRQKLSRLIESHASDLAHKEAQISLYGG